MGLLLHSRNESYVDHCDFFMYGSESGGVNLRSLDPVRQDTSAPTCSPILKARYGKGCLVAVRLPFGCWMLLPVSGGADNINLSGTYYEIYIVHIHLSTVLLSYQVLLMLSTRNFLFLSSLTAVASEFTDFKLVSTMDFTHPAFLEFVNLKNEPTDLSVTVFSASEPGEINLLKNITNVFSDPDYVSTLTTELISEGFEWLAIFHEINCNIPHSFLLKH